MKLKYILFLCIIIHICSKLEKCDFKQGENIKSCQGMATLCAVELKIINTNKLNKYQTLLTDYQMQKDTIVDSIRLSIIEEFNVVLSQKEFREKCNEIIEKEKLKKTAKTKYYLANPITKIKKTDESKTKNDNIMVPLIKLNSNKGKKFLQEDKLCMLVTDIKKKYEDPPKEQTENTEVKLFFQNKKLKINK